MAMKDTVEEVLSQFPPGRENLLLILHDLQQRDARNHIDHRTFLQVAHRLEIPLAELDGVISFYSMISRSARGIWVISLCDSTSCRIQQSTEIYDAIHEKLQIKWGETTKDGLFTLELVNCLGSCSTAPNMMINGQMYRQLTPKKTLEILQDLSKRGNPWDNVEF